MALTQLLILLTAVSAISTEPSVDDHGCVDNKQCTCLNKNGMLTADCSGRNLTNIPKFTNNIQMILLNNNNLTQLPNDSFTDLTHLELLDLSDNQLALRQKTGNPFKSLVNLKTLILHNNAIDYRRIGKDLFSALKKLTMLDLSNNMKTWLHSYPTAITKCKSLQVLKLDGIEGTLFDENFKGLLSLEQLSFSSSNCNVTNIPSTFFENMTTVKFVDFSLCNLTNIELGTFRHLESLTFLNLSYNHYLTFRNLRNITTDLGYTNITTLDLSAIHCTFGVGTFLYRNDVIGLQNTSLLKLYLDTNRIAMVENGLISKLPETIEYVSIKDNKFTMGVYIFELGSLKNLRILDTSFQLKSHDPNRNTNRFRNCKDWRGPVTTYARSTTAILSTLAQMKTGSSKSKCPSSDLPIFRSIFKPPPNLQYAYAANNKMQYPIRCISASSNNSLKHIDLHNNVLNYWQGPIYECFVEFIDLSNNLCSYVSNVFFRNCSMIKVLNISNNMLGFVLGQDEKGEIFQSQTVLHYLNLSNNRIVKLPAKIFKSLLSLEVLDLSGNQLDDWSFDINHMKQIRMVNLSNNDITSISSPIRQQIHSVRTMTNLSIDLDRNRLQCTCDTVDFMEWMSINKHFFKNFDSYRCQLSNHSTLTFTELNKYIPELKRNCNSYTGLIFGVITALLICIIVVAGGLVYRYRWRLRYIYFLAKNRYRGFSNLDANRDDNEYRYDAFVSYSDKDSDFIINNFQQKVEDNRGVKLCFHQRDFIPGNDIAANITNAIQHSRKTIAILSRNYLNSYWCMFDFNMARMESIYSRDGKNVLFFVLYEDIPPRDLPLNMMDIIESQSYIEYPRDQLGDEVFWGKVVEAIQQ